MTDTLSLTATRDGDPAMPVPHGAVPKSPSAEWFHAFGDHSADWAWETDVGGRLTYSNALSLVHLGLAPEAVVGYSLADLLVDVRPVKRGVLAKLLDQRLPIIGETVSLRQWDGMERMLEVMAVPLIDGHNRFLGFRGLCRDITEDRRTLETLAEREHRYRTVVETAGTGIFFIEADKTITLVNTTFAEMTGYARHQIEGRMAWTAFFSRRDLPRMAAYHDARRQPDGDAPNQYAATLVDRDGGEKPVLVKVNLIPGTDQSVASLMDISELTRAQQALVDSEETYRSIFEHSGSPSLIVDEDMTVVMANAKFTELTGFDRASIEGRMTWAQFVAPEDVDKMKGYHIARRAPGGNAPSEYECTFVDRQGQRKRILLKVGMLPDGRRSILSLTDITLRVQAEAALRESQAQLNDILDSTDAVIYTCDRNYRVTYMNRAARIRQKKGGASAFCYGRLHGRQAPCPTCEMDQVFDGKIIRKQVYNPAEDRWYAVRSNPIVAEDGTVSHKKSVVMDITEQKRIENDLRESESRLEKENRRLRATIHDRYRLGDIIGKSPEMQGVYDTILSAAANDANTIIYGESGTGKELAAKAIHALSDRADASFVPVNCGAIPENLFESEFFGYCRGAFSGAATDKNGYLDIADGGTLFLDELGEIPLSMQVKLLRAIDGGGFRPLGGDRVKTPDVRIIAATNRDLKTMVRDGSLREDFYYRVHVIPIQLPPLRNRSEDIPLLVDHFLSIHGSGAAPARIDTSVLAAFQRHPWPGNVRELENAVQRYLALKSLDFLGEAASPASAPPADLVVDGVSLKAMVDAFEKAALQKALEAHRWQKSKTAASLGIHRKTLFTKMRQHGLE